MASACIQPLLFIFWFLCQLSSSLNMSNMSNSSNSSNTSNTTAEPLWREYTVGFFVSSIFFSGSSDNLYFQLCSTNYVECTSFYMIEDGMPNTGETYYFMFNTTNIGDINHVILGANGSDAFCLGGIKVDDGSKINNLIPNCLDTDSDGSCDVLNITLRYISIYMREDQLFSSVSVV